MKKTTGSVFSILISTPKESFHLVLVFCLIWNHATPRVTDMVEYNTDASAVKTDWHCGSVSLKLLPVGVPAWFIRVQAV